jgi:hypothetical protein
MHGWEKLFGCFLCTVLLVSFSVSASCRLLRKHLHIYLCTRMGNWNPLPDCSQCGCDGEEMLESSILAHHRGIPAFNAKATYTEVNHFSKDNINATNKKVCLCVRVRVSVCKSWFPIPRIHHTWKRTLLE